MYVCHVSNGHNDRDPHNNRGSVYAYWYDDTKPIIIKMFGLKMMNGKITLQCHAYAFLIIVKAWKWALDPNLSFDFIS